MEAPEPIVWDAYWVHVPARKKYGFRIPAARVETERALRCMRRQYRKARLGPGYSGDTRVLTWRAAMLGRTQREKHWLESLYGLHVTPHIKTYNSRILISKVNV